MQYVVVTPGKIHQTKYGAILHSDLIGRRYGTKVGKVVNADDNEGKWL